MISFEPLWETLKTRKISCYALINKYRISRGTIDNLKHNRNVTLETVCSLCRILNCRIEDIVEYIPESETNQERQIQGQKET